jgi:hypothetical protein
VYKRIDTPEFHNIHYVREMLFQVRLWERGCKGLCCTAALRWVLLNVRGCRGYCWIQYRQLQT